MSGTFKTISRKDTINAKISGFLENGRIEISSKKELEKFPIGSVISYTNKFDQLKSGGFIIKFSHDYFIFITPDFSTKYRVRYFNVSKMWVGDVYKIHNDIVSFAGTSQKKTNFSVTVNNIIVYYGSNTFDMKRFMSTQRYKNLINWHNYFIVNHPHL